jgi:hypothetical protein
MAVLAASMVLATSRSPDGPTRNLLLSNNWAAKLAPNDENNSGTPNRIGYFSRRFS